MAGIQDFKELESEIHEQIYNNLYFLSHFYPTSDGFKKIFKKDMFVRNNKAAFFEVIYYLLNTLNPELTAQRLLSWPPYDINTEAKFRSEILSYVNELNTLYDSVKIPQVMASHLISPGGYKIAHFIFKLSQLVMFEHLKKTDEMLIQCPTAGEYTCNIQITNLMRLKSSIEREVELNLQDFDNYYKECQDTSKKIMDTVSVVTKKLKKANRKRKMVQEEFNKKYPNYPSFENLKNKFECLTAKWSNLKMIIDSICTIGKLLSYLNSSDVILEYNKDQLKVPNEILHIIKKGEELNLTELFQGVKLLLEYKTLEMPNVDHLCNDKSKESLKDNSSKYLNIAYKCEEEILQLSNSIRKLNEKVELIELIDKNVQENIYGNI